MWRAIKHRSRVSRWLTSRFAAMVATCLLLAMGHDAVLHGAELEDIEFVAEHLPEVAMDDRYAALPLGTSGPGAAESPWQVQAGFLQIAAGDLELAGPMLAVSRTFPLSSHWQVALFGFLDDLSFDGATTTRPLAPLFSNDIPLALPADAQYQNFAGSAVDIGFGAVFRRHSDTPWLGSHVWLAGLLVQRMALRDYSADYLLLSGPDAGIAGTVDYSADYDHVTPIAGLELHREYASWSFRPRILVALPLPRRPVAGRMTGPGFDISGDTDAAGHGVHFGDPSLTLGFGITYEPYGLTIDLGSTVTQALLEPVIHKGIDRNWMLSLEATF